MNHKSKKRLSILKKAIASEESSPTFTKINRRISFSGKKSVKEFTSDEDKMTIWGNSYEESADMAQSASHPTIVSDSTINQSMTSTTLSSKTNSEAGNKENEHINLRNRTILKRKSNVLKAIRIQPVNDQKDITPNTDTVSMDISMSENDNLSQKRLSIGEFLSPKKIDHPHRKIVASNNHTPVPPTKITKFNDSIEETIPTKYFGRRISDESSTDSCIMATTYDNSNFSIPSRILDKGDINLTYGFNLSEFDILQSKPHRPSENATSFATKIDRINFTSDDESNLDDSSVLLQIQNPQIEQMRLTGTIVTDTDQNLNISIEISDNSKVLDRGPDRSPAKPPPKPNATKENPVLEMFKIRNQLKKRMAKQFEEKLEKEYIVPFKPAKFDPPVIKFLDSTNHSTNDGLELKKVQENTTRQTILFAKETNQNAEVVASTAGNAKGQKAKRDTIHFKNDDLDTSNVCQKDSKVNKKSTRETIHFSNQELDTSMLTGPNINPIKEYPMQGKINKTESLNITNKISSDRQTVYFQNNDLDLTGSTSFEHHINKIENISRGLIHIPNQEINAQTKRDTLHFPDQQLEMSLSASNSNVSTEVSNKPERPVKRETIHFGNHELDMSINSSVPNMEDNIENIHLTMGTNVNEEFKKQIKRETIYFKNEQLETSMAIESLNKNFNLIVDSKICEDDNRDRTLFINDELEISADELSPNLKCTNRKRETIHFRNQELDLSMIQPCSNDKGGNKITKLSLSAKVNNKQDVHISLINPNIESNIENINVPIAARIHRQLTSNANKGTIGCLNPQMTNSTNIRSEDRNQNITRQGILDDKEERQTKRDTIHFPNQELEMSIMQATLNVEGNCKNKNEKLKGMPKVNEETKPLTEQESIQRNIKVKRETIHFPDQELDISTMESILETKSNITKTSLSDPVKLADAHTKRGTIHFTNQQLELSTVELDNGKIENKDPTNQRERVTKRCTINFINHELETSLMEASTSQNVDKTTVESYPDIINKHIKRDTIHFPNQELEISTLEAPLNVKNDANNKGLSFKVQTKQATIQENGNRRRKNRETINFPNQDLEVSIMESDANVKSQPIKIIELHLPNEKLNISTSKLNPDIINENRNITNVIVDGKNETQTKRSTIHFPNQELDVSAMEPAQHNIKYDSKNETIEKNKNEQIDKNKENIQGCRNLNRKTIHFPNQELDTSSLEYNKKSPDPANFSKELKAHTKRGTLHFPNQELEISTIESSSNTKSENENKTNNVTKEKEEIKTKRKTILFQNQELETSMMESCVKTTNNIKNIKLIDQTKTSEEYKAITKRGTIHFPNQQLEMSMESYPNAISENKNLNFASQKVDRLANRGTIYFPNQELDSSLVDFPNQEINKSMMDISPETHPNLKSNIKNIHISNPMNIIGNQKFDISTFELNPGTIHENRNTNLTNTGVDQVCIEVIKEQIANNKENIQENKNRKTIHFPNQELDTSLMENNICFAELATIKKELKPSTKRGTLHFPNQELEMSTIESSSNTKSENRNKNNKLTKEEGETKRKTIHFQNQQLDTSMMESCTYVTNIKFVSSNQIKPSEEDKTSTKSKRGTLHFPNQQLEMSMESYPNYLENKNVNLLDRKKSENRNKTGAIPKLIHQTTQPNDATSQEVFNIYEPNRQTIHYQNQDLETTLDFKNDISDELVPNDINAVACCVNPERKSANNGQSINCRKIIVDYNDKTNVNVEDLNMSNDFDEQHIKQQSTMTMAHIVKFLSEKRKIGEQQVSDINLDNIEIDLSSYEKHEEQLANNLSGLKLYGQDSTYENNTQALCNLDPKRIFCVSKYDAMNAAATNQSSMLNLPAIKSNGNLSGPNISTHQLQGENTLNDIVPRFAKENNNQDFMEITANLAQQNKTRQEICNDYINLTISRFSSSFANSSNPEQIDQTNINLVNSLGDMDEEEEHIASKRCLKYVAIEEANQMYQNVDKILTRKRTTHVPVLDLADCQELLNQPSFTDIANAYKLKNLQNLKRVSELQNQFAGPDKPSLRFLMNNYREQLTVEKPSLEVGIIPFLPLIPKITVLLQNKLAERNNYWTCHDTYYNHGILIFTHHRVPCVQIKMIFDFFKETEFGELEFTSVIPMMSKTKIISSTFELIQHLQFFKRVPSEMKNACRSSNEILDFLDNLDNKIIKKNYEEIKKLKDIVVSTNSKIWHKNETGEFGITKSLIHCRNIYDIVIKISDLENTDISDVTVKPHILPTSKVAGLSQGLNFLRELLEKPRDYFNFYE